ncbi:multi-pass transmembrane protein [Cryptosporidium ryanae]|uniref:multi-pass transmembrane protein n=1 Tax=Cryptosporidium ryanae TaxID=515981 RepID=UPI003519F7FE|nr:multi-pass transmembrane protein [Cryptosporidium ryanae]
MNRFSWENGQKTRNNVSVNYGIGTLRGLLNSRYIFGLVLLLIWYICTWFVGAQLLKMEIRDGIYTKSLFVKELDSVSSLREAVTSTQNERKVVIFYSSYCAYCYMVSNTIKRVAESLAETGIKFYAFECGKGYNECSLWGVSGLPNIRLIEENGKKLNKDSMTSYVEFPDINCTRVNERFIEFPEKFTPKFIDIPYFKHNPEQSISMSVISHDNFILCSIIRAFNLENVYKPVKPEMLISTSPATLNSLEPIDKQGRWNEESLNVNPSHVIADSVSIIFYLLRNWVFFGNTMMGNVHYLEKRRYHALYRFVETNWALIPSTRSRKKFREILLFLKNFSADKENSIFSKLSQEEWQTYIDSVQIDGISTSMNNNEPIFRVCKKSLFCGLWLLFHTWSISLLKGVKKQGKGNPIYNGPSLTPSQLVSRIAETVKYFLVCQTCREHFQSMIENNTCDRTSYIPPVNGDKFPVLEYEAEGLVFWLFRVHNLVTLRTATESSYDNMKQSRSSSISYVGINVSFPPKGLCPDCYGLNKTPATVTNEMLDNYNNLKYDDYDKDLFNQEAVVAFLESYYWIEGWILPETNLNVAVSESKVELASDVEATANSDPFVDITTTRKIFNENNAGSVFDVFPVLYPIITFFIFSLTVFYLVETGPLSEDRKQISI